MPRLRLDAQPSTMVSSSSFIAACTCLCCLMLRECFCGCADWGESCWPSQSQICHSWCWGFPESPWSQPQASCCPGWFDQNHCCFHQPSQEWPTWWWQAQEGSHCQETHPEHDVSENLVATWECNFNLASFCFNSLKKVPTAPPKVTAVVKPVEPESFSTKQLPVEDIDQDRDNPQLVSYYAKDIYSYLRQLEVFLFSPSFSSLVLIKIARFQQAYAIKAQYMDGYLIRPTMRTILVDWLVDVHGRFKMLQETLYLSIAVMDSFLQVCALFFNIYLANPNEFFLFSVGPHHQPTGIAVGRPLCHAYRSQIRRDVGTRDQRLCLHVGQGLYE